MTIFSSLHRKGWRYEHGVLLNRCTWSLPAECKLFKRLGLRSTFYTDEEMLAAFPLKPPPGDREVPPAILKGAKCPLCRTSAKKEVMKRTSCCHQVSWVGFRVG